MVSINPAPLLFKDKPLFGLDIGFGSLKVMQLSKHSKKHVVDGYGVASFDPSALKDGVIQDYTAIAKAAHDLFSQHLVGDVTTRRTAMTIPATRTFNRTMRLPKLSKKELDEAVKIEAEQYIPVPVDNLYIDYEQINENDGQIELLMVAVPRRIVDSYLQLAHILGLEVVAAETTINASGRLFIKTTREVSPAILIDFGSVSSDITIFDKSIVVTGTALGGGDSFTSAISQALGVTRQEAHIIKTKYGLGVSKKQKEITEAVDPLLQSLLKEIRRMIRYYEERARAERKIAQVITMGGGANMPGLSDWMTDHLRLPVRMSSPWDEITFGSLQPPSSVEKSIYITVAGLALMNPREAFA